MVKEVDPSKENLQIVGSTIKDLRYLATGIRKLFGHCKGFGLSGNWIKTKSQLPWDDH